MPDVTEGQTQNTPDPNAELDSKIGNIVNAAVTAHIKRFAEKSLPELIANAMKPITEKITAQQTPPADDEAQTKGKNKQTPELLAMAKQLEDMKNEIKLRDEKVAAAEKKAREDKAYSELVASLEGKVRPELRDVVAKHLFLVDSRIEVDENGNSLFKTSKPSYPGGEPEDMRLPLRAGLEDWLKSDFAKPFLPPPNAGASAPPLPKRGQTPPPTGPDFSKPAANDADKARRAMERERLANERLAGRR